MRKIMCRLMCVTALCAAVSGTAAGAETELTVSAAASLKDVMSEIEKAFIKENPGVKLIFNFGSSGSLQKQIEQGAPVDVFVSASPKQMDELVAAKLIDKTGVRIVAKNDIVLIVPSASSLEGDFKLLASASVKKAAVGETRTVPVGQYSLEVLKFLGIDDAVMKKAVFAKDTREVLAWVETGNVDAGIVYRTDALVSKDKVRVIATAPAGSHKPVIYPAGVVTASGNKAAARKFVLFLTGKGQQAFRKNGFSAAE